MELGTTTPVLRILDESAARKFYADFLGFSYDWEHRFEDDLPLYAGISRSGCQLHLSGHHGDAIPGSRVRVLCSDVHTLQKELAAKKYKYARPEVEEMSWARELSVLDPFGNRIIFYEPKDADFERDETGSSSGEPSEARDTVIDPIGADEIAEANADFASELNLNPETFKPD